MLFDHIGIHGWDDIEALILSAVVSDLSVLFIGDIGSNKTEGSKIIAKAVLGPNIKFRNYEVSILTFGLIYKNEGLVTVSVTALC